MRFNQRGKFNVPFCHKTERFAQAYVTKITNQVRSVERILLIKNWQFVARDFPGDFSKQQQKTIFCI